MTQPTPQGHAIMNTEPDTWLHAELRAKLTELADMRLRLAATERHCTDLRHVNQQLREELADCEAELYEAREVIKLLPPVGAP